MKFGRKSHWPGIFFLFAECCCCPLSHARFGFDQYRWYSLAALSSRHSSYILYWISQHVYLHRSSWSSSFTKITKAVCVVELRRVHAYRVGNGGQRTYNHHSCIAALTHAIEELFWLYANDYIENSLRETQYYLPYVMHCSRFFADWYNRWLFDQISKVLKWHLQ